MKSKKCRKNVKRYHKTKKVYKRHKKQKGGRYDIIELQNDIKEIMNSLIPGRTESVITSN